MATAFVAGSLLAGGGGAAAGAAAGGSFLGLTASQFGIAKIGFGIAGQVFSGLQQSAATKAAGKAEALAAESRAIESESQALREETQESLESLEREKLLRTTLAEQRARFGGAGIDPFSGSPARIQEVTESEIKRKDRQAGLFSALTVSSLNRQAGSHRAAGSAAKSAADSRATTNFATGLSGLSSDIKELGSLIK